MLLGAVLKKVPDPNNNSKVFFQYANSKLKTRSEVPNLIRSDGTKTTNDSEKADELNKFFSSLFTEEKLIVFHSEDRSNGLTLQNIDINEALVKQNLEVNKTPGPDGLHPRILSELSNEQTVPLTLLFQKLLGDGVIPKAWKEALITPIFKKGSKSICDNYRPVSLTKTTNDSEKADELNFGKANSGASYYIPKQIYIQLPTQLLDTIDTWTRLLDKGSAVDTVYLDFAKAFDSVPHRRLVLKLEAYGIKGALKVA